MKKILLIIAVASLTSCTMKVNLTASQKKEQEANKFARFRTGPKQRRAMELSTALGYGMGLYYKNNIQKH